MSKQTWTGPVDVLRCKKTISAMILAAAIVMGAVLTGCATGAKAMDAGKSAEASSFSQNSSSESDNSAQIQKENLKTDPSKGAAYNAAINAYNKFLSGKINAINKINNKTFNINDMDSLNNPGINNFALFDVNGDGIPELQTRSDFYDVFSIKMGNWLTGDQPLISGKETYLRWPTEPFFLCMKAPA